MMTGSIALWHGRSEEDMVHEDWALACVRDSMTAWNRRDWAAFESLHSPDVVYESPHHSPVTGRTAVMRRYQEVVEAVPDVRSSELRMVDNDCARHRATFEYVQTGTLADKIETPAGEVRGKLSPFVVHTTMFVRFDDDGRMAGLRTVHD
jgi:hypothetical protein